MRKATLAAEMLTPSSAIRPARMCSRCALQWSQKRHLSNTASRHAQSGQVQMPRDLMGAMPTQAQRSRKSMMKEMTKDQMPNDIGLNQGTLIAPSNLERIIWLRKNPKMILKEPWLYLKKPFISIFSLFYALKWTTRKDRITGRRLKSPPMQLRQRAEIATSLHAQLGYAIAKGNINWIREHCCQGLIQKLQIRLDYRKTARLPEEKWSVKYLGTELWLPDWLKTRIPFPFYNLIPGRGAKPVSDTIIALPIGKDSYLRQVVCQIRSKQTLETEEQGEKKVKSREMLEYIVIQRMSINGEEKPWMVWGTTEPTSFEKIEEMIEKGLSGKKSEGGIMDQVKSTFMARGGGGAGSML